MGSNLRVHVPAGPLLVNNQAFLLLWRLPTWYPLVLATLAAGHHSPGGLGVSSQPLHWTSLEGRDPGTQDTQSSWGFAAQTDPKACSPGLIVTLCPADRLALAEGGGRRAPASCFPLRLHTLPSALAVESNPSTRPSLKGPAGGAPSPCSNPQGCVRLFAIRLPPACPGFSPTDPRGTPFCSVRYRVSSLPTFAHATTSTLTAL